MNTTKNELETISESEITHNPIIELREIDGNILNGKVIRMNAAGMINNSLRNSKDGVSYFGIETNMQVNIVLLLDRTYRLFFECRQYV